MFQRLFTFALALSFANAYGAEPEEILDHEQLFYIAESPFEAETSWEFSARGGYIFSDPYLNLATATGSVFYLIDKSFSVGAEGTAYFSWNRKMADGLNTELGEYGFSTLRVAIRPEYSAVGVLRFTPLTGMINFLSAKVILADISLLARGGTVKYQRLGHGLLVGTGLAVHLGFSSTFGVETALLWDGELPPGREWQSRVGFRLGPTVRF